MVESESYKSPPCFARSVPAHRDKAEIKCMGPVGGKHQRNQKVCLFFSNLKHSEQDKVDKFMSVALITFVRSDRSTLWKDNLSMYMSFSLYLSKIECVTF